MKNFYHRVIHWLGQARERLVLAHVLLGSVLYASAWLIWRDPFTAALLVTVFFYARELAQYQARVKALGASNLSVWHRGWFPHAWGVWSFLDWFVPSLIAWFVTWEITAWTR